MSSPRTFDLLRGRAPAISVGILAADIMNLSSELVLLERAGAAAIHFDVMDGWFVPVLTAGPPIVKGVKTGLLKDVHLMIREPETRVADYVLAGADMITVHAESGPDVRAALQRLGSMENRNDPERGLVRGVAVSPATPLAALDPLLSHVEMVTVLAVDPGDRKTVFAASTGERVAEVRRMVSAAGREILLCIDGGVNRDNIAGIAAMGADIVVSGSAVFAGGSPVENLRFMQDALLPRSRRGPP